MSLRPFLSHLEHHPDAARLARAGARAFVSQSLRPYLIAALADRDARRPTVVVAGDDRAARDLAADLRAWLRPRAVRFYPSRGVAYESHLAPPPHLVGLRVAALDALLDAQPGRREAPVVVVSAVALSREGPRPRAAPARLHARASASCSTSTRPRADLVAAGYERVDQVEDRGQFAVRGGLLDVYPATEERAVRVDLFDDEIESLRWFSTFTQRSLGDAERVEIAPAAELAAEHRELAEIAALEDADERPDIAELLPVDRLPRRCSTCCPSEADAGDRRRGGRRAGAARPLAGRLRRLPRHRRAPPLRQAGRDPRRARRAPAAAPVLDLRLAAARVPRPGRRVRRALAARGRAGAREARRARATARVVTWPRRGEGERAAYNLARLKARWDGDATPGLVFAEANLRDGFIAPGAQARGDPRAPAVPPPRRAPTRPTRRGRGAAALVHRPAHRRHRRPRGPRHRALRRLRHQDRRRRHARLPGPRVPGHRQGLHAGRPAREDLALRRRRRRRTRRSPSSAARAGTRSRRAPAAPRRSSPASCSTSTPSASAAAATRSRPTRTGCASSRPRSRTARRPTSARRSSRSRPTWSPSARWTA